MKKTFRFSLWIIAAIVTTLSLAACSDDDDDKVPDYANYYIECTNVSGGGLTSQSCSELQSSLNADLVGITLSGYTQDRAVSVFNELMNELARSLSSELHPADTLRISYALKTTSGLTAKTATIVLSRNGASVTRAGQPVYTVTIE